MPKIVLYADALRRGDAATAARWAAEMTPQDVPRLLHLLRTERHYRIHEEVAGLVARLGGDVGELLAGAATDDDLLTAGAALARVGDARGLAPLRAVAAPGKIPWMRFEALKGLGMLGDWETLERTVTEPDINVRVQSSAALVRCGPAAVPALTRLLSAPDEDVVRSALYSLAWLDRFPPEAECLLRHPEPYTRSAALFALQRADADEALRVARELASDPEPVVRRRAAALLGDELAGDPDPEVRSEAMKTASLEVLCRAVESDPSPDVRLDAVVAAGRLGDQRALPALDRFAGVIRLLFKRRKERKAAQRAVDLARGRIRLSGLPR